MRRCGMHHRTPNHKSQYNFVLMSDDEYEPDYEPECVSIGDSIHLEVLSVVAPPLEYMASLHSNNQEISGRQVWTGSVSLANTLLHLSEDEKQILFDNRRILELGSGTGILGMALSKICHPNCTPAAIVLTDGDPMAIKLLKENLENPYNQIDTSIVKESCLLWGVKDDGLIACPTFAKWCCATYNAFRCKSKNVSFDSIFAGDVLYKEELPKIFFETAFSLLSKETGSSLWLCHIPRHGVLQSTVVSAAKKVGFVVTTIDTKCETNVKGCPLDDIQGAVTYRMYIDRNLFEQEL